MLICDTAGRLHNKKNRMEELHKIYRILEKEYPEAYLETLVVLDGTTGQNALQQARQFAEVANVTGIILTKLDRTAKGGIAAAIQSGFDIPVKYIGAGESIHDLQKFDADQLCKCTGSIHPKRMLKRQQGEKIYGRRNADTPKLEEASEIVKKNTGDQTGFTAKYFSEQTGNKVYLKPENMQLTGTYKLRGAYYKNHGTLVKRSAQKD